jgi:hypothetical protein
LSEISHLQSKRLTKKEVMKLSNSLFTLVLYFVVASCAKSFELSLTYEQGESFEWTSAVSDAISQVLSSTRIGSRELQVSPDKQCELFNTAFNGSSTCECSRYDRRDTLINCTYTEQQCNTNMTACFDGSVVIIQDSVGLAYKVTTCTNGTAGSDRPINTCVTVETVAGKDFAEIASCSAKMNSQNCNYCHICGNRNIVIDCCNVVPDTRQAECQAVTENGGYIPIFPVVTVPGQCKGSYGYSGSAPVARCVSLWWLAALLGTTAWTLLV